MRQASKYGELIVFIVSQEDVEKYKEKAIYTYDERRLMISSLRYVSEIVDNTPYDISPELVDHLIEEKKIDYYLHGDDPCIDANGKDCLIEWRIRNKLKLLKRTEGISTTDIIGRILIATDPNYKYNI